MKNVFLKFLSTYILILLLPIILLGWTIYEGVLREFESYIKNTHLSLLHQTRDVIDRFTNEVEWRVFQIANNTELKNLMYQEKKEIENNILLIRKIVNEFGSYIIYTNSFNTTFYVYIKDLDLIITPNASYTLQDFIRGEIFFRIEGMTAAEWHENIIKKYYPGIFMQVKKMILEDFGKVDMEKMVPYIQSLPLGYSKSPEDIEGIILFFIQEVEFTKFLNNINIPEGGWAYIIDEDSNIVTGISNSSHGIKTIAFDPWEKEGLKKIPIKEDEMFVVYTTSPVNNWKYIAVLPSGFVLDKVQIIKTISFLTILISAFVSIIISSVIAYRRAKPIKKMIGLLRDSYEKNTKRDLSKMDILSGSISRLINKSRNMQVQLQEQMKFVRTAFFNNLLNGYFRNPQELNLFLSYAGIDISKNRFIVLLINITGFESLVSIDIIEELFKIKIIVKNTLESVWPETFFFHDINERRIAVIAVLNSTQHSLSPNCSFDRGGTQHSLSPNSGFIRGGHTRNIKEDITREIKKFLNELSRYYRIKPQIGIGNVCNTLMQINNSFEQAKEALDYVLKSEHTESKKDNIVWFQDIHKQTQEYYFPLELEMRLLNSTKAGDKEQVTHILNTIYTENMKKRRLMSEKLKELINELYGTLNKIKNHVPLIDANVQINCNKPVDGVFNNLENVFFNICDQVNARKKSHNKKLIKRIISHIKTNYKDTNLSLYSVSSCFSITESYLSYFFKEQTGTNFSFFLEKIRIDNATELLNDSGLSIKRIAQFVGYNSDKTFRRVFKRVKGLSPSDYRQNKGMPKSG